MRRIDLVNEILATQVTSVSPVPVLGNSQEKTVLVIMKYPEREDRQCADRLR